MSGVRIGELELRLTRQALRVSLLDGKGQRLFTAAEAWQPRLLDGLETYTLLQIWPGIRALYRNVADQYRTACGSVLEEPETIAVRGMGGGWMAFDPRLTLLTPYRGRWAPCPQAAQALSQELGAPIGADSGVACLYDAILREEPYLPYVDYVTNLPGYVYWRLSGFRSLDRAGAAEVFPLDASGQYDGVLLERFDRLAAGRLKAPLLELLPEVLAPGEGGGSLLRESLRMLDPSGELWDGIPLLAPVSMA